MRLNWSSWEKELHNYQDIGKYSNFSAKIRTRKFCDCKFGNKSYFCVKFFIFTILNKKCWLFLLIFFFWIEKCFCKYICVIKIKILIFFLCQMIHQMYDFCWYDYKNMCKTFILMFFTGKLYVFAAWILTRKYKHLLDEKIWFLLWNNERNAWILILFSLHIFFFMWNNKVIEKRSS